MFTANRTSYKDKHYQLSVNTTSPGKKGFWAIDSVRQCYEKGNKNLIRVLMFYEQLFLQIFVYQWQNA